jgi:hypothetical protein
MDIGKSFQYVFEDPNWIAKVAIGGAIFLVGALFSWLLLVPLLAAAAILLGYYLAVTRNVAQGNPTPLPAWDNFGALFSDGLKALVGVIVWTIPVWILVCCIWAAGIALGGATSSGSDAGQAAGGAISIVTTCLSCLTAIISIVIAFGVYAPLTRYALNGELGTFWDFSGNIEFIRANASNYFIAFILGAIVAGFIGQLGAIACGIGYFFTSFWGYLVAAHLFGQVARQAAGGTVGPAPMAPYSAPPPVAPVGPA